MLKASLLCFTLAACLALAACGSANNGASRRRKALLRGLQTRAVAMPAVVRTGAMPLKRSAGLAGTDYTSFSSDENGGDGGTLGNDPEYGNNGDDAGGDFTGSSDENQNPGDCDESQAAGNDGPRPSMDCDPARLGCSTGSTCNNCQCCRGYLGGCWKPGTPLLSFAAAFYC